MNPTALRKRMVRVTLGIVSIGLVGLVWNWYSNIREVQKMIALCEAIPNGASLATIKSMAATVAGTVVSERANGMTIITFGKSECHLELASGEFIGRKEVANR